MCNTEWNGKWNISATLAIQVLESSTLCCSHKSTLMMYIPESIELIWLSWYFISRLLAYLADLARPTVGCSGTQKAMDSRKAALDVVRVLSREQHNVLLFKIWIECIAEIFHFLGSRWHGIPNEIKNGISRQRSRFKFWKVARCAALAKVV